jgi:hypothetical protein
MDGIFHDLSRKTDPAKLLGYLNFSDGRPDTKFQRGLADAAAFLLASGESAPWRALPRWLLQALGELEAAGSPPFRESTQVRAVLDAALARLPAAYREHHADLLAHQSDADIFVPFFLARSCEAVLKQGAPWGETERIVSGAIALLNDYVGYRPIALLETRPNTEYFPREKVRPVPLFLKGAGVAPGKYADLIRPALELLSKTDPVLLDESSFTSDHLDELAFDPRAHDHFHPVNKRPNVLFGEWDPHTIDGRGYYRRFVLRQMTLDTLLTWVEPDTGPGGDRAERLFEAAAVLAGTILMGAGISGSGPGYHDSSVTLSRLVPRIARYRDAFYQRLLKALPGPHGERLREEAEKRQQPFAGVRQYLNQAIATQRAQHLQDRRLAQFYAAMGYPTAARERAARIVAPAVRFGTEIRIRQTEAGFAADRNEPSRAAMLLAEVEDLLRRGIDCGALIDPWNILGYQGLFPIFPGREDTVRDPRAEELINQIGRQFDLYAKATAAAAVSNEEATRDRLANGMRDLAAWWDKFATATVTDLPRVVGTERAEAAEHVARALAEWSKRAPSSNDVGFWRQHREGFTSPAAFAQVIEPLIARHEYRAAMALLMTWLSEGETVPLEEVSASFERLSERWVRGVAAADVVPAAARSALVRRFFELLEANVNESWLTPDSWLRERDARPERERREFESAYEGMTYKDSAEDGEEGSVAGAGEPKGAEFAFPLEAEADVLEERLRFLHAIAKLWRLAARPELWPRAESAGQDALAGWLSTARGTRVALIGFLDRVTAIEIPDPPSGHEGMIEFDRRRALKGHIQELGVSASVEMGCAARTLAALLATKPELTEGKSTSLDPPDDESDRRDATPMWEHQLIRLERAIVSGDLGSVRMGLPGLVVLFRSEPLLYCPPSDGGRPHEVLRAQTALHVFEDLLTRLPRLGLLRETFQLTKLARQMEWNNPPDGRRVSSFDQLFRTALTGVVETLLVAAADWEEDAGPDGPLSGMLFQLAEAFQELWVQHSQSLRLSVLESVTDDDDWEPVRRFVKKYGSDLFTVPFLGLSNMRGILARGVTAWLDHEADRDDSGKRPRLVDDWAKGDTDRNRTARAAEVVLQALVEHYDEYRDYNTTTTQSDYGENIHILLDFLRIKVRYDRYAWRLRPLALAHEVLCKRANDDLAGRWRDFIAEKTAGLAEELLDRLGGLEVRHGVKLRTIRDRIEERFLLPLEIDQAAARVAPAARAALAGEGEENPDFARLRAAVEPLAENVSGVGLDVPAWVRRLEEALRGSRIHEGNGTENHLEPIRLAPGLDFEELRRQLADWDRPLGD